MKTSLIALSLVLLGTTSAIAAPAKKADTIFNCNAIVIDKDKAGDEQGYIAHFQGKVKAAQSEEWKVVTLTEYNGVKVRLAFSNGRIHTISISDGDDDITKDSGTVRSRRQDFWHELTTQDLELAVGKVTYYVGCSTF